MQNLDLTTEELNHIVKVKLPFKGTKTILLSDVILKHLFKVLKTMTHRWKLDIKLKKASGVGMRVVLRR